MVFFYWLREIGRQIKLFIFWLVRPWPFWVALGADIIIGWALRVILRAKITEVMLEEELISGFAWAVLTVVLIVASLIAFLPGAFSQMFRRREVSPLLLLCPIIILSFAIFLSLGTYLYHELFYWGISSLVVGVSFFLYQLFHTIQKETFGPTLWERVTHESRKKREPVLNEGSSIGKKVFKGKIRINRGDAILAICDSIEAGRALARKIITAGDYGVYITSDKPWTIIRQKYEDYKGTLLCIDCFTNYYGFEEFKEFKQPENIKEAKKFYADTLKPLTIKKLHSVLRDARRRTVSEILYNKNWSKLCIEEKEKVREILGGDKPEQEIAANARIIYDSVCALASIFDIENLLNFLIHDTNVDKTIGRNTLLLVKKGVLKHSIVKKMESFCDISLHLEVKNKKINITIKKVRDEVPPKCFSIDW